MTAIILVGGFGTRLRPLTLHQPKGLLPVFNRPFLSYQVEMMRKAGIKNIIFAAGIHNKKWERGFKKIKPAGVKFSFAYENKPLGTGGAIRHAYDQFRSLFNLNVHPVLIVNGDIFMDLDMQKFLNQHKRRGADVSIALIKVDDPSRFGLVLTDKNDRIKKFVEKPTFKLKVNRVNAGAYLFHPGIFGRIPSGKNVSVEKEVFPTLLKEEKALFGHQISGYWNDIGTPSTYLQAHLDLAKQKRDWTEPQYLRKRTVPSLVFLGKSAHIHPKAQLNGMVSIGAKVKIGSGAVVTDSVIFDGCIIGENVLVEKAILGKSCRIGHHSRLSPGIVLGEDTKITPHTKI